MTPRGRGRLRHRRLQAALAVAAVSAAVALPVLLLSVGGGVVAHELAALENAGYQISVSAAGVHGIASAHSLAASIDGISGVATSSPVLAVPLDVFVGAGGAQPALAEGVVPAAFLATSPPDQRALFPNPLPLGDPTDLDHYDAGTYTGPDSADVVLASPFAATLGVDVGATVLLAAGPNRSTALPFAVTGLFGTAEALFAPTAANAVVLPLSDLQLLTGNARSSGGELLDAADTLQVALTGTGAVDPAQVRAVAGEIQALVPYYGVTSLTDEATQLQQSASILDGFYVALSSVSLIVGGLFLTLVQVRRVESERGSIAIRRAIGVPARHIAAQMLQEATVLAGAGVTGGLAVGLVTIAALVRWGSPTVSRIAGYAVVAAPTLLLLGLSVLLLALPAAGLATRAALRLNVPEALR